MHLGSILGGALLGAVGLTAAAYMIDKHASKPVLPDPSKVRSMTSSDLIAKLVLYVADASALNLRKYGSLYDCGIGPLYLPNSSLHDRLMDRLERLAMPVMRRALLAGVKSYRSEAINLFNAYHGIFKRAYELLEEDEDSKVFVDYADFLSRNFNFDDDINSERWAEQYDSMLNAINGFINATIDAAVELNDKLDASDDIELEVSSKMLPASV